MALGGGCCHTQLAALNVFERSGRLVGFFWALIFCGALVQLKQNTTKKHWAVKGSRWVGRWCSVLYSWARLGRKTKLSILNHSWVSPFSSLCCLCCSFRKIPHFYFLQEGDDPCCLLAANSLFLSCHFFFLFLFFLLGASCLWYQMLCSWLWEMRCLEWFMIDLLLRQIIVLSCHCESTQMLCKSQEKSSFHWLLFKTCWIH